MSGGWDRMVSGDPVTGDRTLDASNATRTSFPPTRDTVIRYMLAQRLDFAPGSRFAYSNFGYMLLGRVIEKISGQAYDAYVRDAVLTPSGLPRIQRAVRRWLPDCRAKSNITIIPGAPLVNSYVSAAREKEPAPMDSQISIWVMPMAHGSVPLSTWRSSRPCWMECGPARQSAQTVSAP